MIFPQKYYERKIKQIQVGFHIMIKRVVIGKDDGLCYEEGF